MPAAVKSGFLLKISRSNLARYNSQGIKGRRRCSRSGASRSAVQAFSPVRPGRARYLSGALAF
jgi:hypothetical protein